MKYFEDKKQMNKITPPYCMKPSSEIKFQGITTP